MAINSNPVTCKGKHHEKHNFRCRPGCLYWPSTVRRAAALARCPVSVTRNRKKTMKTTVNRCDFKQAFVAHGRKDQFTYDGLNLLFDYLEDYEEGTGQEIELDVIALCCDYYEDTAEAIAANYNLPIEEKNDGEILDMVLNYLHDNTILVGQTDSTIVYTVF